MSETTRLEDERSKIRARLLTQTTDKCRPRTYFELASCEARLGRPEEALASLRDAIACGLDAVYAEDLRTSAHFESLRASPSLESVLAVLEGRVDLNTNAARQTIFYAHGERERCQAESLLCGHCNEPLKEPQVHNPCGSLFCSSCLDSSCPQCQGPMPPESVSKVTVRLILNKLDVLKVCCPRCFKTMERATIHRHIESCPVYCPSGCKQKISPTALDEHANVCVAVEVPCNAADVECTWVGPRKDLYNHTRGCPFVKQQAVLRRVMALEETMSKRAAVLEEWNRELSEATAALKARVARLEGTENLLSSS